MILKELQPLPLEARYRLIYADPPWVYRDKASAGQRGAGFKYRLMTVAEISALPVKAMCRSDSLLALWWVGPQPLEALHVVKAWGFSLVNALGFVWIKSTKTGKDHFGMGNWTRANAECCLLAKRGKPIRQDASVRQLVRAPVRAHSQKPDEVRERLEALYGTVRRLELFARQTNPGWDSWGNEIQENSNDSSSQ